MGDRYARHELVPGWRQPALQHATVVVVGLGALGNTVAQTLALAGVGRFILCDPDRVSVSNLSRGPLFRARDVGCPKVDAAARSLRELVPGVAIETRATTLVRGVGLAELRDASLVLGCLDSRAARLELNGRCALVRARWIDGGTTPWGGEVRPYLDPDGSCYGCGLAPEARAVAEAPWSCADDRTESPVGASQPVSALVAAWMALLAVRSLMGAAVADATLLVDGVRGTTEHLRRTRDPECPYHRPLENVREVNVRADETVGALLDALKPSAKPLAWGPVMRRVECRKGHFGEERWGAPERLRCPTCGELLQVRTTLELDRAPREVRLDTLGVAPREIIAVRSTSQTACVELAGGTL